MRELFSRRAPLPANHPPIARPFATLWLAAFLFLAFHGASVAPPSNLALSALAASGSAWFLLFERSQVRRLWNEHRAMLLTVLLLAAAILFSEAAGKIRGEAPAHAVPPQAGLLLCLPALALFLHDERTLRAVVLVFAAVCAWHLVAMPLEAVTGLKVSWHPIELLPRDAGPFHYQASGLARQSFLFPGLFLPLFYLAWGPISGYRIRFGWSLPQRLMLLLPWAWLVPALSVQSRSAFAGAFAAALLATAGASRTPRPRAWLAVLASALLAGAAYWILFAENKSGAALRLAYFELYLREALDPRWLLTGRSLYLETGPAMFIPGMTALNHSHNDIAQILYSWGLPALAAYVAFWVALVRLVWTRFVAHGEYWPACALVALLPNMVTDLGLQHYEKAVFLVLLTAFCLACAGRPRPATAAAGAFVRP